MTSPPYGNSVMVLKRNTLSLPKTESGVLLSAQCSMLAIERQR